MSKSDVYSWRITPETRAALEAEARLRGSTLAALLDRIAAEWLRARRRPEGLEDAEQARLHAAAALTLGRIAGTDPRRAERAREKVRERLARRRDG